MIKIVINEEKILEHKIIMLSMTEKEKPDYVLMNVVRSFNNNTF